MSGNIIQELWQQGSGGSSEHFWEYWEVPANSREPTSRDPGPLPPEFTPPNRHTWVMPTGWTGTGTRHDCYAEWDRRPGHPRRLGLVAFAGTDEYRAGDAVRGVTP